MAASYQFQVTTERWSRKFKTEHSARVAVGRAIAGSGTQELATITGPGIEQVCISTGAGWCPIEYVATHLAAMRQLERGRKHIRSLRNMGVAI